VYNTRIGTVIIVLTYVYLLQPCQYIGLPSLICAHLQVHNTYCRTGHKKYRNNYSSTPGGTYAYACRQPLWLLIFDGLQFVRNQILKICKILHYTAVIYSQTVEFLKFCRILQILDSSRPESRHNFPNSLPPIPGGQ